MQTPFIQHLCDHSFSIHTVKIICCDITSSGNTLTHGSTFYSHGKGSSLAGKFLVEAEGGDGGAGNDDSGVVGGGGIVGDDNIVGFDAVDGEQIVSRGNGGSGW